MFEKSYICRGDKNSVKKKSLLNAILFSTIVAIVYSIWAIQPLPFDDWVITKPHSLFSMPPMPKTGQQIRYYFNGEYFFTTSPFSFLKVWSLFTAILSASLFWALFSKERIVMRAGLTLLTLLGFPYFGHIGTWNMAAATYTGSVVWMALWYVAYRKIRRTDAQFLFKAILFFVLTFIAASWHEVWLISFAGIVGYLIFDAIFLLKKRNQSFNLRLLSIHFGVVLAYVLAIAFYTRGGPSQFVEGRLGTPDVFGTFFNWPYITKAFLLGTKESLVLIKDTFPVFLLITYVKLNKKFQNKLSSDYMLFFVTALGSILFTYVYTFLIGAIAWRVRWLCAISLSVAFYALPGSIVIDRFRFAGKDSFIKVVRVCSIVIAAVWLSYNTFFTYIYTNIDVGRWLQYRQMVLDRDPAALEELSGSSTMPKNRSKGVATRDHIWGIQDDRYRFFWGPSPNMIRAAVKDIWDSERTKEFFIY